MYQHLWHPPSWNVGHRIGHRKPPEKGRGEKRAERHWTPSCGASDPKEVWRRHRQAVKKRPMSIKDWQCRWQQKERDGRQTVLSTRRPATWTFRWTWGCMFPAMRSCSKNSKPLFFYKFTTPLQVRIQFPNISMSSVFPRCPGNIKAVLPRVSLLHHVIYYILL